MASKHTSDAHMQTAAPQSREPQTARTPAPGPHHMHHFGRNCMLRHRNGRASTHNRGIRHASHAKARRRAPLTTNPPMRRHRLAIEPNQKGARHTHPATRTPSDTQPQGLSGHPPWPPPYARAKQASSRTDERRGGGEGRGFRRARAGQDWARAGVWG